MDLDISTERDHGICTVRVEGEIDVYTSPSLKAALIDAVTDADCAVVIVDMDAVGFIDSSGLGVLVGALRRMKEAGGEMRLVCDRESVMKIFRITGLDRVFSMFPTLALAQEA